MTSLPDVRKWDSPSRLRSVAVIPEGPYVVPFHQPALGALLDEVMSVRSALTRSRREHLEPFGD